MSKVSPDKYYQNNKERLKKNLVKDIKVFLKKKRKKKVEHGQEQYKNLPEVKRKGLLSIELF